MGKAARVKQQTAQQKIAAQRAAAKQAERRRQIFLTGGSVAVVLVVVLVLILANALSGHGKAGSNTSKAIPASVADQVEHVPVGALDSVGGGSVASFAGPTPIHAGMGSPLISGGKPEMLYIGAEYCPYCAATRWSMAVALSRFGTFTTPLKGIYSSSTDRFAHTATLTFYKSKYTSPYLNFTPVEHETVTKTDLQPLTAKEQAIWNQYEPPTATSGQGYPFIDLGNKWAIEGPLFDPATLGGSPNNGDITKSLLSWSQIAAALKNPSSPVAQGVDGEANYITAAICSMTGNKPASVCSTATIKTMESKL